MTPRKTVILGACSRIAEETARLIAAEGGALALAGRDAGKLAEIAADLKARGAVGVSTHALDLDREADKPAALAAMSRAIGGADSVLVFYGALGDQKQADADPLEVARLVSVNFTSAAMWMTAAAALLKATAGGRGVLLAVSSVAGDRGRRSNYAYGAAKAGLSVFMQGLAHRFAREGGVRVVTMKLGFVRTAMTRHMKTTGPLWAEPGAVARAVRTAMEQGGPIVYAPWFWRYVMLAIRATPAPIFNKVNI